MSRTSLPAACSRRLRSQLVDQNQLIQGVYTMSGGNMDGISILGGGTHVISNNAAIVGGTLRGSNESPTT